MIITREKVAEKLLAYLNHRISLAELIDWCENAVMDAEFEKKHNKQIRNVVGRIGVADVNNFGLLWEDCESFLKKLGYSVKVDLSKVA